MGAERTDARTSAADRAAHVRFRRAVALMLMTLVLPGSAQLVAGNPRVGLIALRTWLVLVLTTVVVTVTALVHHPFAFWLDSSTGSLLLVRWGLMALAIGW